ncbi:hypothetical protein BLNAU_12860 [Blattamonas nauphoetae]|uniref:SWIM-type domain-containing protein n=1 Tax=Blattamonas nauphoetae TaxID=2049346 RepID=A0ABQ9XLB9_9EUKA|nr:hypothetical protein BLNAU_12860 [Blattamonas nauphoetae]
MNPIVSLTANELFAQIKQNNGQISDSILFGLTFIFKKVAQEAISLLEENRIVFLKTSSGRGYYRVEGKNEAYLCYPHYCSCLSFMYSVVLHLESCMCKHQLAIHIGEAMGCIPTQDITDNEYEDALTA